MNGTTVEETRDPPHERCVATGAHVVTVAHNSAKTLEQFFDGIAANAGSIAHLTLVDNDSTDRTVEVAEALTATAPVPVTVLRNRNDGFAGGYAAAGARAPLLDVPVLCLNPDVVLAPGTVAAMLDVLHSFHDAGVVTAPLVELDGTPDSASRRRLPTLGASMIYSILGRFTPRGIRYNSREDSRMPQRHTVSGLAVSKLEATTGALMLVAPGFRRLQDGMFDDDYWMYGEDLQLCADAARGGRTVLMAEVPASVHVKGASSGRPRSTRSNRAFHDAMSIYAAKNLLRSRVALAALRCAIEVHFHATEWKASPARRQRASGAEAGAA